MSKKTFILIEKESDPDSLPIENWKKLEFCILGNAEGRLIDKLSTSMSRNSTDLLRMISRDEDPKARTICDKYLDLTAGINKHIKHHLWPAADLSTKNMANDRFFNFEICLLLYLDRLIDSVNDGMIIGNLSKTSLEIIRKNLHNYGHEVHVYPRGFNPRDMRLYKFSRFFYRSFVFVNRWNRRMWNLKRLGLIKTHDKIDGLNIIRSYGTAGSCKDGTFKDPFFQPLIDYMEKSGTPYRHLIYMLDEKETSYEQLPLSKNKEKLDFFENYLNPLDLFRAILDVIVLFVYSFVKIYRHHFKINGVSITKLLLNELTENFTEGGFLDSTLHCYFAKRFFNKNGGVYFIYPFENISWERLFLEGIKQSNVHPSILGFQHSLIIPVMFPTKLSKEKGSDQLLPSRIITTGEEAKRIMQEVSNYPNSLLEVGCALRQRPMIKQKTMSQKRQGEPVSVLVTSNVTKEMISLLRFVFDAKLSNTNIGKIKIRFHPLYGIDEFEKHMQWPSDKRFIVDSASLSESAQEADVILYSASTAAIECLMEYGKPVIHIDTNDILEGDPLKLMTGLKRNTSASEELEKLILELTSLSPSQYEKESTSAFAYLERYFKPINEDRMKVFLRR